MMDPTPQDREMPAQTANADEDPREWLSPVERARLRFLVWRRQQRGQSDNMKDLSDLEVR